MNQGFMMLISIRAFVNFIHGFTSGKINFVSEELASQGFTLLFFHKGNTDEERKESYKRY
jgi:hypothetical protein